MLEQFPLERRIITACKNFTVSYYSPIASFNHIWSRERAKYDPVMACRFRTEQIRTEGTKQQNGWTERKKLTCFRQISNDLFFATRTNALIDQRETSDPGLLRTFGWFRLCCFVFVIRARFSEFDKILRR